MNKTAKNTKSCSASDAKNSPFKHQLTELLWIISPGFTRWAESKMDHQKGFTPQRIRLMALLLDNGPMMMRELRDELGVTATNITALVDALEKDGMVKRKPNQIDRRATIIALTKKAEKAITDNCPAFKERVSELFAVFNKGEQEQMVELLNKLKEALIEKKILQESCLN